MSQKKHITAYFCPHCGHKLAYSGYYHCAHCGAVVDIREFMPEREAADLRRRLALAEGVQEDLFAPVPRKRKGAAA